MLCIIISLSGTEVRPHAGAARPTDVRFLYLEVTEMLWLIQGLQIFFSFEEINSTDFSVVLSSPCCKQDMKSRHLHKQQLLR